MRCHFIPPYLLDKLATADDSGLASCGHDSRLIDDRIRARRSAPTATAPAVQHGAAWQVYTAAGGSDLPGTLLRTAGEPEVSDVSANEAATGVSETLALYTDLGRDSFDGTGATVLATVHYQQDYDNAFWDGTQLVCGDGDGKVFGSFTKPIDVLGHELSHALTQYTADLTYDGQSGALNESVSDVFGSCVKQRHLGQDAASADWLIGEGIFQPGITGVALRSMKAPGTAYDDPAIGKDPQVGSMADYVTTTDDNGGVHTNSGIPNRAFYLAATAIGGTSWEGAGRVWYAALTSGVPAGATFAQFADACVKAAGDHADAVRTAWETVGVLGGSSGAAGSAGAPAAARHLAVTRSGGFAGQVTRGSVDLAADDDRASEARSLLDRVDLAAVPGGEPAPDRFVYTFDCDGTSCQVHETALTPDLRRLAELALS